MVNEESLQRILLNLSHHSILFVDSAYQESQRAKWRDWLPQLYSAKGTIQDYFESNSEHRRDLHIQIELNRLKYTVFGNVSQLRP